jgi:dihydropteroate synthase
MILRARDRRIVFPRRPLVMGIVNLSDDSFSGDGSLKLAHALARAAEFIRCGADVIDIGGESARTNRLPISSAAEVNRLQPFIERFAETYHEVSPADPEQIFPPLLALNTWRSEVVSALLPLGVDVLNDIGALPQDDNARIAAANGTALVIMHSVGLPKQKHTHIHYPDIMLELERFFAEKIALTRHAGLDSEQVIIDPGIDFAKQQTDNLRIFRELERLMKFERPILLPVSRKTVIGETVDVPDPADRDPGTLACIVAGITRGANIFRVHNVTAAYQAVRTIWSVLETSVK